MENWSKNKWFKIRMISGRVDGRKVEYTLFSVSKMGKVVHDVIESS